MYKSDSNQQKYIDINILSLIVLFLHGSVLVFSLVVQTEVHHYIVCVVQTQWKLNFMFYFFQYTWRCQKGIVKSFPQMGLNISGILRNVPIFWVIVKELILNSWLKPWLRVQCLMWCVSFAAAGRHSVMFSVCIRYMAKNNDYVMMSCPVCWSTGSW